MKLLFVSFNLFRESDSEEASRDLARLLRPRRRFKRHGRAARPDLVGLNEAANHKRTIERAAAQYGYDVVTGTGDRDKYNNVLLVNQHTLVVKKTWVRRMALATNGTPERWQVTALLETKGRRKKRFKARVDHANSHVERESWWRLPRFTRYVGHIRQMVAQARSRIGTVFFGDLNVSFRSAAVRAAKLLAPRALERVGARSSYAALGLPKNGTHGRRLIDYVIANAALLAVFEFAKQWIETGYASDHNPILVVVRAPQR